MLLYVLRGARGAWPWGWPWAGRGLAMGLAVGWPWAGSGLAVGWQWAGSGLAMGDDFGLAARHISEQGGVSSEYSSLQWRPFLMQAGTPRERLPRLVGTFFYRFFGNSRYIRFVLGGVTRKVQ
jgi:hypothetical protein